VPIYQAAIEAAAKKKSLVEMTPDEIFAVIEKQAQDGVDFITVHCGVTLQSVARYKEEGRVAGVVSRGGAFMIEWMNFNKAENPLYSQFDRLLDICKEHNVTLSLGDGFRPGCVADATDRAQLEELLILGELVDRARKAGVQAMVEGPGHVSIDQIETNIKIQKEICKGAPFYVLGPLVTDIAPGYDHITAAIGGAWAAYFGADFLCPVGTFAFAHSGGRPGRGDSPADSGPRGRCGQKSAWRGGLGPGHVPGQKEAGLEEADRAFHQPAVCPAGVRIGSPEGIRGLHHVRGVLRHEENE